MPLAAEIPIDPDERTGVLAPRTSPIPLRREPRVEVIRDRAEQGESEIPSRPLDEQLVEHRTLLEE
jgi:hypothetical protein